MRFNRINVVCTTLVSWYSIRMKKSKVKHFIHVPLKPALYRPIIGHNLVIPMNHVLAIITPLRTVDDKILEDL